MSRYEKLNLLLQLVVWVAAFATVVVYYRQLKAMRGQLNLSQEQTRTLRDATLHQILVSILFEYRSLEMLVAIQSLWEFKQAHPTDLGKAYETNRAEETKRVAAHSLRERLEEERTTLHFKRRLVSQFYQHVAGLYDLRILPGEVLFMYWSKGDLKIIPDILIPIESALAGNLGTSPSLERLKKLYDDCPA